MKTNKLFNTFFFICVLTSLSISSFSQNTTGSSADMQVIATPEAVIVDYTNPDLETLDIVIYDMNNNVLKYKTVTNASGQIVWTEAELEAVGGQGFYTVILYSTSGGDRKKVKNTTIVITKE
jgi:hypothetical protein